MFCVSPPSRGIVRSVLTRAPLGYSAERAPLAGGGGGQILPPA